MKKIFLSFIMCIVLVSQTFAQIPVPVKPPPSPSLLTSPKTCPEYWARSYFTEQNVWACAVASTVDGYIVAGNAGGATGMSCVFVVTRLHHDGHIQWQKSFSHGPYRQATCILEVNEQFYIAGYAFENGNNAPLIIKLDTMGNILWEKIYPRKPYNIIPSFMIKTQDNGLALVGQAQETQTLKKDVWVLKISPKTKGKKEWEMLYDYKYDLKDGKGIQSADETGISIAHTSNGEFLVAANLFAPKWGYCPWFIHADSLGILKSQIRVGKSGKNTQITSMTRIADVKLKSKNVFAISGFTDTKGDGTINLLAAKIELQSCGVMSHWQNGYNHTGPDYGYSIDQADDGRLILVGTGFTAVTNSQDALILKLGLSAGSVEWASGYGNLKVTNTFDDCFLSVQKTKCKGFVVAGYTESFPYNNRQNLTVMSLDRDGFIDTKYDASCLYFNIDIKPYGLDWGFLDMFSKPCKELPISGKQQAVTSLEDDPVMQTILLCDEL